MFYVLLLLVCLSMPLRAETWQPERTWVFAVSATVFKFDKSLAMDPKGRRDTVLVETLHKRGVPREQIVFLMDKQATHDRILKQFEKLLDKTRPGDCLLFYFQGHGSRDITEGRKSNYYFMNYDSDPNKETDYLYLSEIFDRIGSRFRGSSAFLTADCCNSGGLIIKAGQEKWTLPTACLSSVNAHNESTGEWTYTDCLIRGFRGDARVDLDRDGAVTLAELGRYTQVEMAFLEDQKAMFAAVNGFPRDLQIAPSRGALAPLVGRHVRVKVDGETCKGEILEVKRSKAKVLLPEYVEPEWVPIAELLPYQPPQLAPGTRVQGLSSDDEEWYPGRVLRSYRGLHEIRFDDYSSIYDEWLPWSSIKVLK